MTSLSPFQPLAGPPQASPLATSSDSGTAGSDRDGGFGAVFDAMPDKTGEAPPPPAEDASLAADDTALRDGEVALAALLPTEVKLPGLPSAAGLQIAADGVVSQAASGLASGTPPGEAAPALSPAAASGPPGEAEPSPDLPLTAIPRASQVADEKVAPNAAPASGEKVASTTAPAADDKAAPNAAPAANEKTAPPVALAAWEKAAPPVAPAADAKASPPAAQAPGEKAAPAAAFAEAPADPHQAASRPGQAVLLTAAETRAAGQMLSDKLLQAQADTPAPPGGTDTPLSGSFADEAALPQQPAETRRPGAEAAGHVHRATHDGPPPAERQIVTAIHASGTGRTDILLDPQELGRVRLTLEGNEAGIVVTIQAERSETADLLRRNADLLAEEFREAGYTDLTFSFTDRGETASAPDRNDDPPRGTEPEFVAAPPPLPSTPGPRGSALLDLRL